jgi:hypothetical protein
MGEFTEAERDHLVADFDVPARCLRSSLPVAADGRGVSGVSVILSEDVFVLCLSSDHTVFADDWAEPFRWWPKHFTARSTVYQLLADLREESENAS